MGLESKVVVITGYDGALGAAASEEFPAVGPQDRFIVLPAGLSRQDGMAAAIESIPSRWGRIDGLVHLVGGFAGDHSVAETDRTTHLSHAAIRVDR